MKLLFHFCLIVTSLLFFFPLMGQEIKTADKKEQVLDFTAGVIEGDLNRPSILLELGNNFNDFDDLVRLREDFNSFHKIDSVDRFRYIDEAE